MKKISTAAMLLVLAALLILSGCQKEEESTAAEGTEKSTIKIGISKIVQHPALDAVEQGIQDELADLGYTNIEYDLQNANGDMNTAGSIANKFKSQGADIAVGIATPTAVALANSITDIPVIFTAVTDPVDAKLVSSLEKGEGNITGVSDMTPVREQLEMLFKLVPVRRLGHVYSSGESNAVRLAAIAKAVCEEKGIEFIESTVTNSAEVKQAAETIVGKVDAIYVSTDNTVVSAFSSLSSTALAAGVPLMSADPSSAEDYEVMAAYGFDYYSMGRVTGRLIEEVLKGKDPATIPTQFMTDPGDLVLFVNMDIAKQLGIEIPTALLAQADVVVENGVVKTN